jgi:hypothetical protein
MTLEHIKVWKFDDAPAELKIGCRSGKRPQWLVLVPRSIKGSDLDEAIQARSEVESLFTYQTASGDVIYVGSEKPSETLTRSRYVHVQANQVDDQWLSAEDYLHKVHGLTVTHGICPDAVQALFSSSDPDLSGLA